MYYVGYAPAVWSLAHSSGSISSSPSTACRSVSANLTTHATHARKEAVAVDARLHARPAN